MRTLIILFLGILLFAECRDKVANENRVRVQRVDSTSIIGKSILEFTKFYELIPRRDLIMIDVHRQNSKTNYSISSYCKRDLLFYPENILQIDDFLVLLFDDHDKIIDNDFTAKIFEEIIDQKEMEFCDPNDLRFDGPRWWVVEKDGELVLQKPKYVK